MSELSQRFDRLESRCRQWNVPTWILGLIVMLIGWSTNFAMPSYGLDPSWWAGLYLANDTGLQFGTEVVFTYGPLGFLKVPFLFFDGPASIAFLYAVLMDFAFSCALIWTLRSRIGAPFACLVAFLAQALLAIDPAIGLAVLWGFALLSPRPPRHATTMLISAGAVFAAAEALMKLSSGPVIFVVLLVALVGARAGVRQIGIFLGAFVVSFLAFWLITAQSLANLPDFAINTIQIVLGYNDAMATYDYSSWAVPPMVLGVAAIVAWNWLGGEYADRRARIASTAMALVVGLAMYKQGVVRMDSAHIAICLAALFVIWAAIPTLRKWNYVLVGGLAIFTIASIHILEPNAGNLDVINNIDQGGTEVRTLLDSSRKQSLIDDRREYLQETFDFDDRLLGALEGKTVSIDPWEISIAWAYDLDWSPLPVFQSYSAYTSDLDELNADDVASPDGPERILRSSLFTSSLDFRNPNWDPPAQQIATLCNFKPGVHSEVWQVLVRVENRCGPEVPAGEVSAQFDQPVEVPQPGPGEIVFARVHGTEPSGLGRLRSLLYKSPARTATLSDGSSYRLLAATASDGLLLASGKAVGDDDAGYFSQVPSSTTIQIGGGSGDLEFDFFRMKVQPEKLAVPVDQ